MTQGFLAEIQKCLPQRGDISEGGHNTRDPKAFASAAHRLYSVDASSPVTNSCIEHLECLEVIGLLSLRVVELLFVVIMVMVIFYPLF